MQLQEQSGRSCWPQGQPWGGQEGLQGLLLSPQGTWSWLPVPQTGTALLGCVSGVGNRLASEPRLEQTETSAASTSPCIRFLYSDGAKWGELRRACWVLHSTSLPCASRSSSRRDLGREAMLQGDDWEQLLRGHAPVLPISELRAGTLGVPAACSFLCWEAPGDPQVLTHHRDKAERSQALITPSPGTAFCSTTGPRAGAAPQHNVPRDTRTSKSFPYSCHTRPFRSILHAIGGSYISKTCPELGRSRSSSEAPCAAAWPLWCAASSRNCRTSEVPDQALLILSRKCCQNRRCAIIRRRIRHQE